MHARGVAVVVGSVVEADVCGIEVDFCVKPVAYVVPAASPAAIPPAITPTAAKRLALAVVAVNALRVLVVTVVGGTDVLNCISHAPPSEPSRFRRSAGHWLGSELSRPFHPTWALPPSRV